MKAGSTIGIAMAVAAVCLTTACADAAERNFIIPSVPLLRQTASSENVLTDSSATVSSQKDGNGVATKPIVLDANVGTKKVIDTARELKLMPLSLVQTDEEKQSSDEVMSTAEKAQLLDLWTSTIDRYEDIQFAILHLQPTSDPAHVSTVATKALANLLLTGGNAASLLMPNGMGRAGAGMGMGVIQHMLSPVGAKKSIQVSQEQTTMLYQLIRNTADRLSMDYRLYRLHLENYQRSLDDLTELKELAANGGQATAGAMMTEYLLNRTQRETAIAKGQAMLYRKALVDLAGPQAVDKLDKQIDEEQVALNKLVGDQMSKVDPSASPLQDAPQVRNLQRQKSAVAP